MHFYFHSFYLHSHHIVLQTGDVGTRLSLTRNVKLHYFSWCYHASNSLMQGANFTGAMKVHSSGWKSEYEARSPDLNEVIREDGVCALAVWSCVRCFIWWIACIFSGKLISCRFILFFSRFCQQWSTGWLPQLSWHDRFEQIWLNIMNKLHEKLQLLTSVLI